jgi:hypothetical protein
VNVLTPNRGPTRPNPPPIRPGDLDTDAVAPLIVGRAPAKAGGTLRLATDILSWLGVALILLAIGDFAASVYPAAFDNREWELGTLIVLLNGFPRVVLGIGLGAFAAVNRKSTASARRFAWSGVVLAIVVLALSGYVLVHDGLPTLAAQTDPALRLAVRQQIARAIFQALVLPLSLFVIARSTLNRAPLD